jgi:3-oxosteroid 1-dehydrogenase
MPSWDHQTDVVIVGSGAAGMGAALTAAEHGLSAIVVERMTLVGGSSALAGGGMWVPCNHFMTDDGEPDSFDDALRYMEELVGDEPPASSRTRKEAFLRNAPDMVRFLERCGMRFRRTTGYPDYFPDVPGASVAGRGIESVIFDTTKLGDWASALPPRRFPRSLPMGTLDVALMVLAKRHPRGLARLGRIYVHHYWSKLRRQQLAGGGGALVAQLLHQCLQRGIPIWREASAVELVLEGDRPVGLVVERGGKQERIEARRAVFLGAGGFARSEELRQQYQRHPISASWTSAHPGDLGDGLRLGLSAGAATALMDEAWWGPSSLLSPEGPAIFHVSERSKPGSLIVDSSAKRYFNESMDYVLAGQTMYERHAEVPAIPSYLIFDQRYRNRYPFGANLPGRTPQELIDSGYFKRADTLEDLAQLCGLQPEVLRTTIEQFNNYARKGVDPDFHRGDNPYDRYYGDPRVRPNACLAPIEKPPFYAVELVPGDLGTKGGLVTDEHGRVLREDGTPIPGLYASGNTTASVMGRRYPGPGVTLAPALTFAYLAMRHASGQPVAQGQAAATASM